LFCDGDAVCFLLDRNWSLEYNVDGLVASEVLCYRPNPNTCLVIEFYFYLNLMLQVVKWRAGHTQNFGG